MWPGFRTQDAHLDTPEAMYTDRKGGPGVSMGSEARGSRKASPRSSEFKEWFGAGVCLHDHVLQMEQPLSPPSEPP